MRSFLKEEFTDAHTEELMDGRMHDRHNAMTIACWPSVSGANETRAITSGD